MIWLSYGILYDSWIPLVCIGTRLIQVFSACWTLGLVFGANRYHKSVCCTLMSNTHMDVILWSMSRLFWCILHFVLYCTVDLSRISNRLKMYLFILRGIKYMKISLISCSISRLHFMLCRQVYFPGFQFTVHSANEVTPCTALGLSSVALPQRHRHMQSRKVGHGAIGIERGIMPWAGSWDPALAACRISPTKHCQITQTPRHIHHCRWWRFPMYIYFIFP